MVDASAPPFLDPGWLDAQRRYWDAWSDIAQKGVGAGWSRALDDWWAAAQERLGDAAGGPGYQHFIDQSQTFFRMAELLAGAAPKGNANAQELMDRVRQWQQQGIALSRQFGPWIQTLPGLDALGFWERAPLREALNRYRGGLEAWLPALGPHREFQGRGQRMVKHFRALDVALAEFERLQAVFSENIIERLSAELASRDEAVDSLRAFYDLWVDSAEAAYRDLVMREDYSRSLGRVVNSLVQVGDEVRGLAHHALSKLGMTTSDDTDRLFDEIRALRRELAETKKDLRSLSDTVAEPKRDPQ